ncbi:MAG: thioredoxin family protein, partial [Chitinophagaceae bacterium]|nr:thioredoxin family protein [Chitinophagaceae bacterium]
RLVQSVFFCIAIYPFVMHAQEHNTGIQWTRGLSWEQVKQKAKEENKYIFLDCQATWCGPCKKMDKEVFTVDSVGEFFKKNFIAVSVQTDVTSQDAPHVQAWYKDAQAISKEYRVTGLPTFLFFNPQGELVDKNDGYRPAGEFLVMSRAALVPGKTYIDPLARYYKLIERYNAGHKELDSMYYMFTMASQLQELQNAVLLSMDLDKHLEGLPIDQLMTSERIKYMEAVTTSPDSKWFWVFYKYSKQVNRAMKDKNYAQRIVDGVILNTIAYPFLKMPPPGMLMIAGERMKADLAEADWKGLEEKIRREFNSDYAKRNMLAARFYWYRNHLNLEAFATTYYKYLQLYGADTHPWTSHRMINDFSYNDVFLPIDDPVILKQAIRWMEEVVKQPHVWCGYLDTYACLLYKASRKEEAIAWEEKALQEALTNEFDANQAPFFRSVIDKMKRGEKLDWFD